MDSPDGGDPGTVDGVLDALGNPQRRLALYYLRDRDRVDVERLAAVVTAWHAVREGEGTADEEDHRRLLTALHHRHLPRLADAGLVDVDEEAGTVAADLPPLAAAVLDRALAHEQTPDAAETGRAVDEDAGREASREG